MNPLSIRYAATALLGLVAAIVISYNAMMIHLDKQAYANGMAILAAQEAEPTNYSTSVQDGVTWHQKCEKGHCMMATHLDYLTGPTVSKSASAGLPVIDMSAITQNADHAQQAKK
ncbi:hypothetical protein [Pseudomonas cannabina]|nr:hypothetical protein [Pseudomonas cannabina]